MEDRLMTVKQVSHYLSVNERTVLKLVSEGALPGVKVGNQWRFRKKMIDTWLDDQMLGLSPSYVPSGAANRERKLMDLEHCLAVDLILPELTAKTKIAVIEELATCASEQGLVRDKTWFVGALIERENIMPSAIGDAIAYLHTLHRNPRAITRPFLVIGRSAGGVDFDALDGEPTHLFFLLGLKYEELYLPWMQKLLQMLSHTESRDELMAAEGASGIHDYVVKMEQAFGGANKKG